MQSQIQLSIGLPNFGSLLPPEDWRRFIDLGRMADDAGIDRLMLVDHVVMGTNTDAYIWGQFPTAPEDPWLEPLTLFSGIAAATSRVRLATGILIAPLRGAALLAKTAATLDVISGGRLELGVATGWQREEYEAAGLDWNNRGQLLDDTLAACRALWQHTPASFASDTLEFTDIYCSPKPLQPGGVPFWIGGPLHRRNLDRITRWGDGWIPIMGTPPSGVAEGVNQIRTAWASAGRQGDRLDVRGSLPLVGDGETFDLARTMEGVPELAAAGATAVHLPFQPFCQDITAAPRFFREARRRFDVVMGRAR